MKISVVIPTHDRAHLLTRALESVRNQTLQPEEVVVVDDGSSDDTRRLLETRFPEYRYLYQDNRGVSSARNRGIEAARYDWIALLDSDDAWLPGKLSAQAARLGAEPETRLCHTEEIWMRSGRRVNPAKKHAKSGGWIFQSCLPLCVISPSAALIHRSLFAEVGLFDESLPACEDYDLWLRICACNPVAFVETPQVIKYGGHPDQLSHRHWGMDRFRLRALEKIIHSGAIHGEALTAAVSTLIDKAEILAQGAEKRGHHARARFYRDKQRIISRLRSAGSA